MADRPILFSAPMIRALIEGRKTQSRRVLTRNNSLFGSAPRDYWDHADFTKAYADNGYLHVPCHDVDDSCDRCGEMGWAETSHRLYPKWSTGDRLWVREAHYLTDDGDNEFAVFAVDAESVRDHIAQIASIKVRHPLVDWSHHEKLRPSLHMPRWASRLTLLVDSVKVERLHDISENDALAEGAEPVDRQFDERLSNAHRIDLAGSFSHSLGFRRLWCSINGSASWDENPWCAAITFSVSETNIDS